MVTGSTWADGPTLAANRRKIYSAKPAQIVAPAFAT